LKIEEVVAGVLAEQWNRSCIYHIVSS